MQLFYGLLIKIKERFYLKLGGTMTDIITGNGDFDNQIKIINDLIINKQVGKLEINMSGIGIVYYNKLKGIFDKVKAD